MAGAARGLMRRFDVRKVALDDYDWSEYDRLLGEFLRTYIEGENLRVRASWKSKVVLPHLSRSVGDKRISLYKID